MCGILGILASESQLTDSSHLLSRLRHRGPDGRGQWTSPNKSVWLGHTRLAILDLSEAGDQPMRDEVTGNVLVLNGEIYNHLALRRELEALGITFRGHSDTETLLRGYGVWGPALFPRLCGMFAAAIYEARSREVVLVRDRFGIKPLYFAEPKGGGLAFSSEVRPLLDLVGRTLSREGISNFLHWGACAHRRLIFENIREFPSGCHARIRPSGKLTEPVRYWPTSPEAYATQYSPEPTPKEEPAKTIRRLLEDAVESHLLSDVPVACFLSGGIDSSILTALAAKRLGRGHLATFSVGFKEKGFDESQFAKKLAEHYGTQHHHFRLADTQKLAFVERAVAAMDLPSCDAVNTYIVSNQVAASGYKVVLSGLGADEIFGGYPHFRDFSRIQFIANLPSWLRKSVQSVGKAKLLFSDIPRIKNGENLSRWQRRSWSGEQISQLGLPAPTFEHEPSPPLRDAMAEISWGEISHYMRDTLLRDSDSMSMAHSIELRVPFLDNALVETVLAYPATVKFDPLIPKSLLLKAASDLIPEQNWKRPKMGFSLPLRDWMLIPLADFCQAGLDHLVHESILNNKFRASFWTKFTDGRTHWHAVWSAAVLGHYLQKTTS
jgi:asparagine synthase (glutamine-hydrolysing)